MEPINQKHWKLPVCPIETVPTFSSNVVNAVYGFGYDSVTDDYKVVRVVQHHGVAFMDSEVWVYSLKSNSWKEVRDFPDYLSIGQEPGLFAGGALNWVAMNQLGGEKPDAIVSFNLATERYRIVPQPEYKDANFRLFAEVLEGCLCVLCCYDKVRVDIWVMKEYRVKESWKKLMSIEHSNDRRYAGGVKLLGYSKSGGKVLFQYDSGRCKWYDIKEGTVEEASIRGTPGYFEADVCVGNLVRLEGGGGNREKKHATQAKSMKKTNKKKR